MGKPGWTFVDNEGKEHRADTFVAQAYGTVRPGDDFRLRFGIEEETTAPLAVADEGDFLAVYDKKLLWRANLYVDETLSENGTPSGNNDWNNINPWNDPIDNDWYVSQANVGNDLSLHCDQFRTIAYNYNNRQHKNIGGVPIESLNYVVPGDYISWAPHHMAIIQSVEYIKNVPVITIIHSTTWDNNYYVQIETNYQRVIDWFENEEGKSAEYYRYEY